MNGVVPQSHQGILEHVVASLFGANNILKNVRKEGSVKNVESGLYLEIDVWVRNLNICFEFQDVYHYTTTWDSQRPLKDVISIDKKKKERIHKRGETLIEVPCWWDGSVQSLAAVIQFDRPDLLAHYKSDYLIPLNPPKKFFSGLIPGVGELMLASFPLSLQFKDSISPDNSWWMGEKYDGVRACWNPIHEAIYSRSGNEIILPTSFMAHFPKSFLDAEIWFGRGMFPESQKIISATMDIINWDLLRFVSFDDPDRRINYLPFEKRYKRMLKVIKTGSQFIVPALRMKMKSGQEIEEMAKRVMSDKGEGIILRRPSSSYFHGRSHDLIKLKTSRGDQEALVVEVLDAGDTLELLLPDGQTFKAFHQKQNREKGIEGVKRGDIVTFTYDTYSRRALPTKVVIIRSRSDISWEEVVANHEKEQNFLEDNEGHTNKPMGYWYSKKENNVRRFFEDFAIKSGFDPLVCTNWYSVSRKDVIATKKSASVLERFNGSMIKALIYAFPDVRLDPSLFDTISKKYWNNVDNRKRFFIDYAAKHDFDPYVAENWYSVSRDDIIGEKGGGTVVKYYGGSAMHSLMHLFPDIGLVVSQFPILPKHHWDDHNNRRKFFDDLAKEQGFDPLIALHWYQLSPDSLFSTKEANSLLGHYNNNYVKAVIHSYPELSLDQSKFHFLPSQHWLDARNRRKFFVSFARQHSFDPFDPEGWYRNISSALILLTKWGRTVLNYYKGNYAKALVQLFPEVKFDLAKLPIAPRNFWSLRDNRKQFFENVAKSHSFDPLSLEHWYKLGRDTLMKTKGASAVLSYYNGSYITALLDLFPSLGLDSNKKLFTTRSYWRHVVNRRNFFIEIAEEKSFDPLIAKNWYLCPPDSILGKKGIQSVLSYHSGTYQQALQQLFPEINYDFKKFTAVPKNYWMSASNRRKFFEEIANSLHLDPLVPEHWYSIPAESILKLKGINTVLCFHRRSLINALLQLFPEIGLDKRKLMAVSKEYWLSLDNRRRFFIDFANTHKFDPLVAEKWYSITKEVLLSKQGASAVLAFYEGNLAKGLQECFDQVHFDSNNFKYFLNKQQDKIPKQKLFVDMTASKKWKDSNYRRSFFVNIAKKNNFDHLVAQNWYTIPTSDFLSEKGSSSILSFHQGSFAKALINLFPEVTFDKKFLCT